MKKTFDCRESSSESGSTVILDTPRHPPRQDPTLLDLELPGSVAGRNQRSPLMTYMEAMLESGRNQTPGTSDSDSNASRNDTSMDEKPKHYYKFFLLPFKYLKIRFDRLALLALLDR